MHVAVLDLGSNSFHVAVFASSDRAVLAPRRELRSAVRLATSLREGRNGPAFCQEIERRHGVAVEVLSGPEEGCCVCATFTSARSGWS